MIVFFKALGPDATIPMYQTKDAAGFDFHAAEDIVVPYKEVRMVSTQIAMQIPVGWQVEVRPRSGMAKKHGSYIPNSPGTIDSDYRGECCVLVKGDLGPITIKKGDRIAQGILMPAKQAYIVVADDLSGTERGSGGFGSTG